MPSHFHSSKLPLFSFLMVATGLSFFNRGLPTAFLPIVLAADFEQTSAKVGMIMAAYPLGTLSGTRWACKLSLRTQRVARLHACAILGMAVVSLLMGGCAELSRFGIRGTAAAVCVAGLRFAQGVAQAVYMGSNTALISRRFPEAVPYVIGMAEVAVGIGSQLGRASGGFLFEFGGFACPFLVVAALQGLCGAVGLSFCNLEAESRMEQKTQKDSSAASAGLPISELLTLRGALALIGVFMIYFHTGALDTTLPGHLQDTLGPITVGTVGVLSTMGSLGYMLASFVAAKLVARERLPMERMIAIGAAGMVVGILFLGPQPLLVSLFGFGSDGDLGGGSSAAAWVEQITSILIMCGGQGLVFVPTLPLMQSEVSHLGPSASEEVMPLFLGVLSASEVIGPLLGGWLNGAVGFVRMTEILAALAAPLPLLAALSYDPQVYHARIQRQLHAGQTASGTESMDDVRGIAQPLLSSEQLEGEFEPAYPQAHVVPMPSDGESAYLLVGKFQPNICS